MEKDKLTASEVCVLVGCSIYTLNNWYKFKETHPDNEYAKILPEFERLPNSRTRVWNTDDVYDLIKFKTAIPKGRNGILGSVTQKYYKRKGDNV